MMEGSYNQILDEKTIKSAPIDRIYLDVFIVKLRTTVQGEIGSSLEQSVGDRININDAQRLLKMKSRSEFDNLAEEKEWKISGDQVVFVENDEKSSEKLQSL